VSLLRPSEADAFTAAVTSSSTVRVPLDTLLVLWAEAVPRLVGEPDSMPTLVATLTGLAEQGTIDLPAGSWDRSHTPAAPRFVTVAAARRIPGEKPWLRFPWCAELGWASSLKALNPKQFGQLMVVNDWLAATAGKPVAVVPHRFRSAELFGNEKALDTLAKTAMFAEGRLSYELLRCTRYAPPLPAAVVGPGPDVLVVENSDPYWVAIEALRTLASHPIGAVVWGCGSSFPSQVASLATDVAGRGPVTGTIWYWGDLDPRGVAIAASAAAEAAANGLGPLLPAESLWGAFASCDVSQPGQHLWSDTGRSWLGEQLWLELEGVRDGAGRVPQEAVPLEAVMAWAALLPVGADLRTDAEIRAAVAEAPAGITLGDSGRAHGTITVALDDEGQGRVAERTDR
jgi:hypothetical protein